MATTRMIVDDTTRNKDGSLRKGAKRRYRIVDAGGRLIKGDLTMRAAEALLKKTGYRWNGKAWEKSNGKGKK